MFVSISSIVSTIVISVFFAITVFSYIILKLINNEKDSQKNSNLIADIKLTFFTSLAISFMTLFG